MIRNLLIIGCGLIGGSFAQAMRVAANANGEVTIITAYELNVAQASTALELGVVDEISSELGDSAALADFIFIATPVATIPNILARLAAVVSADCVITDAGSTKAQIMEQARALMGDKFKQFVPGHPIAGRETSGVGASDANLFNAKNIVLTPHSDTGDAQLTRVSEAWARCGATVHTMTATQHDEIFAAVSHLPHMLAFALVDEIAARDNAAVFFNYAASGFRDFTRIAGSSPTMWRDIALQNKAALQAELTAFQAKIAMVQTMLSQPEALAGADLHAMMSRAQQARLAWQALQG